MLPSDLGVLRDRASLLVSSLRERWPATLVVTGVDLGPALEQQLYVWQRDGLAGRPSDRVRAVTNGLLPLVAAARAAIGSPSRTHASGSILAVLRQPVHARLLRPVEDELASRGGPGVEIIRVGRAARAAGRGATLDRYLDRRAIGPLLRTPLPPAGALGAAWQPLVGSTAGRLAVATRAELRVLRIAAVGLRAALESLEPAVAVTYDEVGRWGRLLAMAAMTAGVPSADLPHAEAVDEVAMRGMPFDAVAVFGPVAAERVASAGIPPERITVVGSTALDALAARAATGPRKPGGRRIVFASQYLGGVMTRDLKTRTVAAAIEAVAAAAPAELVLVPHPVEDDRILAEAAARPSPDGITVRRSSGSLHDELPGAWLLVTGSSQSVIDAAAVSVPALTLNLTGGPDPVTFAADGLSLGATSVAEAHAHVVSLLDPAGRNAQVDRARRVLAERAGPLDGRAAARIADLLGRLTASSTAGG